MAASAQEKFDAAVKVIRGLPKHGSFQPSHELMLKFYAYYKQATEGPCSAPKPSIWQVVNKRKWEAWSELGQMPKEQAMLLYVEELKNIVETMPQTEQVAEFVQTLGTFYELVEEGSAADSIKKGKRQNGSPAFNGSGDYDMNHSEVIGEMLDIAKGSKGRPDNSPDHVTTNRSGLNGVSESRDESGSEEDDVEEEDEEDEEGVVEDAVFRLKDSRHVDSGSDTDEFCDTSDQLIQLSVKTVDPVACRPSVETSTPVNAKREIRVRFASHPEDSEDRARHIDDVNSEGSNLPPSSPQMLSDRLTLGSVAALAFAPQDCIIPSQSANDSLYVHGSCSSLASLAGDSVAGDVSIISTDLQGDNMDEEGMFDGRNISFDTSAASREPVKSRGGGEEEAASGRRSRVTYSTGFGASWNAGEPGRGSSQQSGSGDRRDLFPGGSGSGGQRPQGGGAQHRSALLDEQVLVTLLRLQQDVTDVLNRLGKLEIAVQEHQCETSVKKSSVSKWWPFYGLSKKTVFFLLAWPFIVHILMNVFCRRRHRR